jgi:hypothetical protein
LREKTFVARDSSASEEEVASPISCSALGTSGAVPAPVFFDMVTPRLRRIAIRLSAALRAGCTDLPLSKERPDSRPSSAKRPPEMPGWLIARLLSKIDSS